jgi:hypothetical protein
MTEALNTHLLHDSSRTAPLSVTTAKSSTIRYGEGVSDVRQRVTKEDRGGGHAATHVFLAGSDVVLLSIAATATHGRPIARRLRACLHGSQSSGHTG